MVGFTEELPRSLLALRKFGAGLLHTYRDTSLSLARSSCGLMVGFVIPLPPRSYCSECLP